MGPFVVLMVTCLPGDPMFAGSNMAEVGEFLKEGLQAVGFESEYF